MTDLLPNVAAVVIGRNEGQRLLDCLASLHGHVSPVVYVDSGSTDQSVAHAQEMGVEVVPLDMALPFTAARARNAGFERIKQIAPETQFVQFLDGDCVLDPDWINAGRAALLTSDKRAVVFGRRREKFPEATLWNRMIDAEWDGAPGVVKACGGDAMIRRTALDDVGGYNPSLIAGEEPDMCYRMRQKGCDIVRIDAEMTRHDAAMTRWSQWWQRSKRAGHTYAEGVALHGAGPERYRVPELRRTLIWGVVLPFATVFLSLTVSPLVLLVWPLQVARLWWNGKPILTAFYLTLGKLPEAQGALGYGIGRLMGKQRKLIEYK